MGSPSACAGVSVWAKAGAARRGPRSRGVGGPGLAAGRARRQQGGWHSAACSLLGRAPAAGSGHRLVCGARGGAGRDRPSVPAFSALRRSGSDAATEQQPRPWHCDFRPSGRGGRPESRTRPTPGQTPGSPPHCPRTAVGAWTPSSSAGARSLRAPLCQPLAGRGGHGVLAGLQRACGADQEGPARLTPAVGKPSLGAQRSLGKGHSTCKGPVVGKTVYLRQRRRPARLTWRHLAHGVCPTGGSEECGWERSQYRPRQETWASEVRESRARAFHSCQGLEGQASVQQGEGMRTTSGYHCTPGSAPCPLPALSSLSPQH